MAKSFKLEDETYLDSSSVAYNGKRLCDILYPVGSIYLSTNSTSPATLFGGTWSRLKGGFLYGVTSGSTYSTGNGTGTSTNSHTLTINQMPAHEHSIRYGSSTGKGVTISIDYQTDYQVLNIEDWAWQNSSADGNLFAASVGGGKGHSHDIPYIAVFMWRRTS